MARSERRVHKRQQQIGDGRYVDYTTWSRGGRTMLGRLEMNEDWAPPDIAAHTRG
ncbi:MAG: hypothetical protein ACRDRO_07495 [Pseudonocardiaceae bacterium]